MQKNKKKPLIGISIVTYNSEEYIAQCLASLLKNNYPNKMCVVVDNASQDQTVTIIHNKFPKVKVLINNNNVGFAKGHNQGIKNLINHGAEYILIFNPDAFASRTLLEELISVFSRKTIGAVSPIITYTSNPQKIWYAGGYFNTMFCFTTHPNMNTTFKKQKIHSNKTDFTSGACMMVPTRIFKQIGLFPEEYFLYFEDVVFSQNLIQSGYTPFLLAKPLVTHVVSASSGKKGSNRLTPTKAYYFARNPLRYIQSPSYGFNKIFGYIGQFCVRFPFYSMQCRDLRAVRAYLQGLQHGLLN